MHPGVLAKVCWDLSHHARSQRVTLQRMITAAVVVFIVTAGAESYWEIQSVKFSCSVVSYSLRPHGLQHTRLPCPSPTPRAYSNSCPLNRWCHPTISSSVAPFSSCLQSFPASGYFPKSQFFTSGRQSIGVSTSTSVLPVNTQDWFTLGWTGWISCSPRDSQESSSTPQFKTINSLVSISLWPNSYIYT